jgi:hypothetical protein
MKLDYQSFLDYVEENIKLERLSQNEVNMCKRSIELTFKEHLF